MSTETNERATSECVVDVETGEVLPATANPVDTVVERALYAGISAVPVTEAQAAQLTAALPDEDHEILPTGEVYAAQVRYRDVLNKVFRPGGWALMPVGQRKTVENVLYQEFALLANGRFISQAIGECEWQPKNTRMTFASAAEAVKSNALVRCCKDLGIASECWDRQWTEKWKAKYAVAVKFKNWKGDVKVGWRRKDAGPIAGELTDAEASAQAAPLKQAQAKAPAREPSAPTYEYSGGTTDQTPLSTASVQEVDPEASKQAHDELSAKMRAARDRQDEPAMAAIGGYLVKNAHLFTAGHIAGMRALYADCRTALSKASAKK